MPRVEARDTGVKEPKELKVKNQMENQVGMGSNPGPCPFGSWRLATTGTNGEATSDVETFARSWAAANKTGVICAESHMGLFRFDAAEMWKHDSWSAGVFIYTEVVLENVPPQILVSCPDDYSWKVPMSTNLPLIMARFVVAWNAAHRYGDSACVKYAAITPGFSPAWTYYKLTKTANGGTNLWVGTPASYSPGGQQPGVVNPNPSKLPGYQHIAGPPGLSGVGFGSASSDLTDARTQLTAAQNDAIAQDKETDDILAILGYQQDTRDAANAATAASLAAKTLAGTNANALPYADDSDVFANVAVGIAASIDGQGPSDTDRATAKNVFAQANSAAAHALKAAFTAQSIAATPGQPSNPSTTPTTPSTTPVVAEPTKRDWTPWIVGGIAVLAGGALAVALSRGHVKHPLLGRENPSPKGRNPTHQHRKTGRKIALHYDVWCLDVWGNATDGYEVNDRSRCGKVTILADEMEYNIGTQYAFKSATPTRSQVVHALIGRDLLKRTVKPEQIRINADAGADDDIYVDAARDGMPLYQLEAIGHKRSREIQPEMVQSVG
jgi:hypothetical protein